MKPPLDRLMSQVLNFTRSGRLQDATAAIQAALLQAGAAAASAPAGAVRARAASASVSNADVDADVVDIEAHVVDTPVVAVAPDASRARASAPAAGARAAHAPAAAQAGRFTSGTHTTRHGSRAYKLFVPGAARPGTAAPLPLVVMLHGCTQNPDDFAAGTRMNDAAQHDGFHVLYPEQSREHNPQGCWNWFKHTHQDRDRGEPAILASMVRAVMAEHSIDPQRVYVAGLSAGGAMAAILGQTHPDLFAAVGVHSGLAAGAARDMPSAFAAMQGNATASSGRLSPLRGAAPQASSTRRPPPTIVFHGDEDRTVHPVNGERVLGGVGAHSVQPLQGECGRRFTRHLHSAADGQVLAEHWVVHGAGHAWSGGSAQGSYADGRGPDATQEMLRFFALHRLQQAQSQPA